MSENLKYGVCGLYCDICPDKVRLNECHGCECSLKDCAADWHQHNCEIYKCAVDKDYVTCADCEDMPCTKLSRFCFNPEAANHRPIIENLRRIKKIGLDKWTKEQDEYFADEEEKKKWLDFHDSIYDG